MRAIARDSQPSPRARTKPREGRAHAELSAPAASGLASLLLVGAVWVLRAILRKVPLRSLARGLAPATRVGHVAVGQVAMSSGIIRANFVSQLIEIVRGTQSHRLPQSLWRRGTRSVPRRASHLGMRLQMNGSLVVWSWHLRMARIYYCPIL